MNVATLGLCSELYRLSGWGDGEKPKLKEHIITANESRLETCPAYDSGYLLAKFDGVEHDISIPPERLKDSADYLAELHVRRFKAEWRKVEGLPYEVSNLGEIRHEKTKRPRKLWKNRDGYLTFGYNAGGGKMRNMFVHLAVAKAFHGAATDGRYQVNHIDRDTTNNNADNLEWVTPQENVDHAIKGGNFKSFGKPHSGLITKKDGLYCKKHQLNHGQKYRSCVLTPEKPL